MVAVTDSQILAALCDVTILVLRAESSTRRVSMQACESLMAVEARLLGVVVNDVSRKSGRYGYYGGYGYYNYAYSGNGGRKHRKHIKQEATPIMTADSRPSRLGRVSGEVDAIGKD